MSDTSNDEVNKADATKNDKNPTNNSNQFRATRIWCDIIQSFYSSVPLKRHRRNLRTYTDCFAASEAIDVLYKYLKTSPNFQANANITRQQAVRLLQIFLRDKIIEDVRGNDKVAFKEFQDDDRLYRFCTNHRYFADRATSKSPSKNIETKEEKSGQGESKDEQTTSPDCRQEAKKDTQTLHKETSKPDTKHTDVKPTYEERRVSMNKQKIENKENEEKEVKLLSKDEKKIWSKTTRKMLEAIVFKAVLTDLDQSANNNNKSSALCKSSSNLLTKSGSSIWDEPSSRNEIRIEIVKYLFNEDFSLFKIISGTNIHHNCTKLNKHGVVVVEKKDDLPAWVFKAMTSMLLWDKEGCEKESEFLNFEDVLIEIKNFFNFNEPLLTKEISQVLMKIIRLLLTQDSIPEFLAAQKQPARNFSFINDQKSPRQQTAPNYSSFLAEKNLLNKTAFLDEEAKLLESAQLPLPDPFDPLTTSFNDQKTLIRSILMSLVNESENCCDDCVNNYSTLSKILDSCNNLSPIEFNEFLRDMESVNCNMRKIRSEESGLLETVCCGGDFCCKEDDLESIDDLEEEKRVVAEMSETDQFLPFRNFEEKMAEMSLCSPTKTILNPKLAKSISDKRLHRNNSFRAAIKFKTPQSKFQVPDLDEFDSPSPFLPPVIKSTSPQPPKKIMRSSTGNTSDYKARCGGGGMNARSMDFSFKQPLPVLHEKQVCKNYIPKSQSINSFCQNSIETLENKFNTSTNQESSRKRKLAAQQTSSSTFSLQSNANKANSHYFSMNQNFNFTNAKTDHQQQQQQQQQQLNSTLPIISFASLESYESGACSLKSRAESFNCHKKNLPNKQRCSNLSLNTMLPRTVKETDTSLKHKLYLKSLSLSNELAARKLSSLKEAFRLCIFMLPPANKRRLHFLLRFLNMLKSSQHSYKHLIQNRIKRRSSTNHDLTAPKSPNDGLPNSYDDFNFIDSSMISNDLTSFSISEELNADLKSGNQDNRANSKNVEAYLIKSFFQSIVYVEKLNESEAENEEEERLGMKLVQILINNYPDVIRIPKELVKNVEKEMEKELSSKMSNLESKSVGSSNNPNDLLNNILSDNTIGEEEKLSKLKNFRDKYPDLYEEKYASIKKPLNILGLQDYACFYLPEKNGKYNFLDEVSSKKDNSELISSNRKRINALANLTESVNNMNSMCVKNYTPNSNNGLSSKDYCSINSGSSNSYLNQTVAALPTSSSATSKNSMSSLLTNSSITRYFFNKLKKENQ